MVLEYFTYIGIILKITLGVNVGKYSIHGSSGIGNYEINCHYIYI